MEGITKNKTRVRGERDRGEREGKCSHLGAFDKPLLALMSRRTDLIAYCHTVDMGTFSLPPEDAACSMHSLDEL